MKFYNKKTINLFLSLITMESSSSSKRPTKRRRTKGVHRLVGGDDDLANGVAVKTTIRESVAVPVEERFEIPIWRHKPAKQDTNTTESYGITSDYDPIDRDSEAFHSEESTTGNTKTQAYYIQEFVNRVDPMLKALLSWEALGNNSICGRCTRRNIATWRCKDCAADVYETVILIVRLIASRFGLAHISDPLNPGRLDSIFLFPTTLIHHSALL
jgi:hypothetical protein